MYLVKQVNVLVAYDERSGREVVDGVGGTNVLVRFLHSDNDNLWPTDRDTILKAGSRFLDKAFLHVSWQP